MKKPDDKAKPEPIDLSEYAEEKVPFDSVIRQIAKAKPNHKPAPKKKEKSAK
jgi:hypothetical protein